MREVVRRGRAAAARRSALAATHQKRSASPAFVCITAMPAVFVALHLRSLILGLHKGPRSVHPREYVSGGDASTGVQKKLQPSSAALAVDRLRSRLIFLGLATLMIDQLV